MEKRKKKNLFSQNLDFKLMAKVGKVRDLIPKGSPLNQ